MFRILYDYLDVSTFTNCLGFKSKVEHPVGFIQDKHRNAGDIDDVDGDQIIETTGSGDDYVLPWKRWEVVERG